MSALVALIRENFVSWLRAFAGSLLYFLLFGQCFAVWINQYAFTRFWDVSWGTRDFSTRCKEASVRSAAPLLHQNRLLCAGCDQYECGYLLFGASQLDMDHHGGNPIIDILCAVCSIELCLCFESLLCFVNFDFFCVLLRINRVVTKNFAIPSDCSNTFRQVACRCRACRKRLQAHPRRPRA